MDNLTERLLDPKTFEEALQDPEGYCGCIEGMDAIRTLHARLATATAEGAAKYLEAWARERRQVLADPHTAWACDPQIAEGFAVDLEQRAAAIRKGLEAKEGK